VFVGPQSRDTLDVQRRRIPSAIPIQFYPDIGHALHAQFPVPQWDPAFALTEGREPINPRPRAETAIYRRYQGLHSGFILYSEGVNDDVNTDLWFALGWSADPQDTLKDYARVFLGPHIGAAPSARFAQGLQALEDDWRGPVLTNCRIEPTLALFDSLEREAPPEVAQNWRFESALYRAVYDAYVRRRAIAEAGRQKAALAALAPEVGGAGRLRPAGRRGDAGPALAAVRPGQAPVRPRPPATQRPALRSFDGGAGRQS
jgi:hypothetical protein